MTKKKSKKKPRETLKAKQGFEDYFNMGPGRSLRKLIDQYRAQTDSKPPTRRLSTLQRWSVDFEWQNRLAERQEEIKLASIEHHKEQAKQSGYALDFMRVAHLNDIGDRIFEHLKENLFVTVQANIGSKNEPIIVSTTIINKDALSQYRGIMEDIAAEMGERVKKLEATGKDGAPLLEFDHEAWKSAQSERMAEVVTMIAALETERKGKKK